MFFFDPRYFLFVMPAILLMLYAQSRVKSAFNKYSQVMNHQGLTGAEVARRLLDANGLYDVSIEMVDGELTDHYDPRSRKLRLSRPVYISRSVAALGIAAHETGHALQQKVGYAPLGVRSALAPVAAVGTQFGVIMIIAGVLIQFSTLAWLGIAFFGLATVFALVTLPVEFNASSRALAMLRTNGMVDVTEYRQDKEMLNAAALTYVAGFLAALMQLLYWITLVGGNGRRQ